MSDVFALLGGIALIAGIVVFLDWWGERKERRSAHRS
jgi:FtsZ-interacting cell division protein ZipA